MSQQDRPDVVLIGAGMMSVTLATFLTELDPSLSITLFEALHDCAQESSGSWNNAGTGHAANCELNYTPERNDGTIDIAKALEVNTEFDISRQLWAHLVEMGAIPDPRGFLHPCPHMSFVQGADNVAFLRKRYEAMSKSHCYQGMEHSEDRAKIAEWAPLVIEGRKEGTPVAATRMITGTDVSYGELTHILVKNLRTKANFDLHYNRRITGLERDGERWRVTGEDTYDGSTIEVSARFVFIGAGGGALPLLQTSGIPEGKGYGGFPVSGIWLRCDDEALAGRHHAKVYGKAGSGSPPMSVPHLDLRIIEGRKSLLFGPYAGFSTRFLKHGKLSDLLGSLSHDNIIPLLEVARDNVKLSEYLVGQVMQSATHQFDTLRQMYPNAKRKDWREDVAGMRVQTIKPHESTGWFKHEEGQLQFGTEIVNAEDKSLVALLGASPGASTAAHIALTVLEKCFDDRLKDGWGARLREMIPTYGIDLRQDADACRQTRADTAPVLKIENI